MSLTERQTSGESACARETCPILGVEVANLDQEGAADAVFSAIGARRYMPVAFLNANNANIAHGNRAVAQAFSGFTVLADGFGVDLASLMLTGRRFRANLNGTDFVPALLRAAPRPLDIALYGARPGVVEKAAAAFRATDPRHRYRALSHGYADEAGIAAMLAELEAEPADLFIVALGTPRQELFIARHVTRRHATVPIAVGALFDFMAGEVPRAPRLLRSLRSEWVYRLALEPGRMWRRYLLGNPVFLARVAMQKLRGGTR